MVKININIQKKDLWLISAIAVFLVGVGVVIAFNPGLSGGDASTMGHSSDEILVDVPDYGQMSLQAAITAKLLGNDSGGGSGWKYHAAETKVVDQVVGSVSSWANVDIIAAAGLSSGRYMVFLKVIGANGVSNDALYIKPSDQAGSATIYQTNAVGSGGASVYADSAGDVAFVTVMTDEGGYISLNSIGTDLTWELYLLAYQRIDSNGGSALTSYIRTCGTDGCTISCDSGDVRTGCGMQSSGGAQNNDLTKAYPTSGESCTCKIYNNAGTCYAICLDTN